MDRHPGTTAALFAVAAFALAVALLAPARQTLAAGPADALVDRVLAAYGGREALGRAKAYRMEGTVTSVMRGNGAFARTFSRPGRLRISIDYPGHLEVRILDGDHGWRTDTNGKLVVADGFLLTSMALQAARANLPWLLDERRAALAALAPMDGGRLQGLEIPLGQGLTLTAYVETATGRIVRTSGVLTSQEMKTNFATDYSDFRPVDGVLFPFHEANFASNQSTGETVVTKVVVNPKLAAGDFKP